MRKKKAYGQWLRCFLAAACTAAAIPAWADDAALPPPQSTYFDIGVGLGGVRFPDYAGAAERRNLFLPFPYIVVHSRFLDVDRNRVRGKLLKDHRFALDVDFGGAVAVKSDDTRERFGMPDLDWLGEAGPALRYYAWRGEGGGEIDGVLPLRVAMSVNGIKFHRRGWVTGPRLEWRQTNVIAGDKVTWDGTLGVTVVDRDFAGYYYGVGPEFATASRPAYAAAGGYAGWSLQLGMSWHHGDLVYGAFIEHTSLHGARFQSSPLVADANGNSFGLALAWVFHHGG